MFSTKKHNRFVGMDFLNNCAIVFYAKKWLKFTGIVEGLNANVKLRFRKAYGFRTVGAMKVALYHQLGELPEPELTHRFW